MRLGYCTGCFAWVVEPTQAKCAYCINQCAPLKDLQIFTAMNNVRIDVHGRLFEGEGSDQLVYEHKFQPEDPSGNVAFVRQLLHEYDEGYTTDMGVGYALFTREVNDLMHHLSTSDEPVRAFMSSCAAGPVPEPETIEMSITRQGTDYTIQRLDRIGGLTRLSKKAHEYLRNRKTNAKP